MELSEKQRVNLAFHDALKTVCKCHRLPFGKITIGVRVLGKGIVRCAMRQDNRPETALKTADLITRQMIALRLDCKHLEFFFRCVHYAFQKEAEREKPESISLVLYFSRLAGCACVGILENEKPITALRIADLFETMNIGKELLN